MHSDQVLETRSGLAKYYGTLFVQTDQRWTTSQSSHCLVSWRPTYSLASFRNDASSKTFQYPTMFLQLHTADGLTKFIAIST